MATSNIVTLPSELVTRCDRWGVWLVDRYVSGKSPNSRAVSSHGADTDPVLQAEGKMGECIFCLEYSLNPITALHWGAGALDADVSVGKILCDIKTTKWRGRFLIWPINKWSFFDSKRFDILALVKLDRRGDDVNGASAGWISKSDFKTKVQIAPAGPAGDKLTPGTPYVDQTELNCMVLFPAW